MTKPAIDKNIFKLPTGIQVRIYRNQVPYSKHFSIIRPNEAAARKRARKWRNETLKALNKLDPIPVLDRMPHSHNKSTGVRGVTCYVSVEKRVPSRPKYLTFGVRWYDPKGKIKTRRFSVGNVSTYTPGEYDHAFRVAVSFRMAWEISKDNNSTFNHEIYQNWKSWNKHDIPLLPMVENRIP